MAALYNDDDSTDDEIGMDLQLAEKLRINRSDHSYVEKKFENSKDYKQFCNMRRKQFVQDSQSSSSSSIDLNGETLGPACSSLFHNKKRQNGDKTIEQSANPKRTCLSDRFCEWRDLRKRVFDYEDDHSTHSESCFSKPVKTKISPSKTYEDHINGLADTEDSDFEIPAPLTRIAKKDCKSSKDKYPIMSSARYKDQASTSAVQDFDSSEDECRKNILKQGRKMNSDHSIGERRLISCKLNKKFLDSDESDDDSWLRVYRNRPLVLSSDSEDDILGKKSIESLCNGATNYAASKDNCEPACSPKHLRTLNSELQSKSKKSSVSASKDNCVNGTDRSAEASNCSSGYLESCEHSSRNIKTLIHIRPNQKLKKNTASNRGTSSLNGCDQFINTDFQRKSNQNRSSRTRRNPRINMTANVTTDDFVNGSTSAPVSGRRISSGERCTRRSGSPHHRTTRSQRRADESKCRPRSVGASHSQKDQHNFMTRFPDVEESENEFFTANSYSDTETSNESMDRLTINTTFVSNPNSLNNTEIICERSVNIDSSTDDEICVVFSSSSHSRNDSRRGASRASGRRYSRGSRPFSSAQDVVSLSPDPVEQVRQVEEDERLARMLQAEFDAELDPIYEPPLSLTAETRDGSISDDLIVDHIVDSDSDDGFDAARLTPIIPALPVNRRNCRLHRLSNSSAMPTFSPNLFFNRRVNVRNRRRSNWTAREVSWPLARLYASVFPFGGEDEYEALLSLDLDGEVASRGLQKAQINRLPTRKYVHPNSVASSSSSSNEITHKRTELNKECQVCLCDYENGDMLRILPCFHEFHTPCIDPWLKINHTCPVCRVIVDLDD